MPKENPITRRGSGWAVWTLTLALMLLASSAFAQSQYFSDAGGPLNWDTTTADWGTSSGGPYNAAWGSGNTAVFEGTAGTVNVSASSSPTVGGITFNVYGYTLSGGTINFGSSGATIQNGGNSTIFTINSVIAGGGSGATMTFNGNTYAAALGGLNTYNAANTTIKSFCSGAGLSFNYLATSGNPSSFGESGTVTLGGNWSCSGVTYTGKGGSTDRQWLWTDYNETTSINNNGSGAINFNATGNAVTGGNGPIGIGLGGTYMGSANTFAEVINDYSTSPYITSLTVSGSIWNLTGANTYSGGTTVSGGILTFMNTGAKPSSGTVSVGASGTLGLGVGGAGSFSSANVDSLFANTLSGVSMNAAAGVAIDTTAGNFTYATSQSAARALTKLGANTLTLSGANSYSGATTVSGGTLLVNGNAAGATSTVTVASGATLGGAGTIGGRVSFNAGSHAVFTNGATLTLTTSLIIAGSGAIPDVHLNLPAGLATGTYTLATYAPAGSSGAFNPTPVIDSGSLASGAGASISTSGGVVSLTVAIIAPTSGRWTNLPGGSWPIAGNWLNGAVASGSGNTADFSTLTLTADTAVTLDWPRTIGNLLFDDQNTTKHAWTLNPGSGAGALTLAVSSGSPVISNNVPTTVGTVIAGANGLTKSGAGALFLTGANTYGGGTTISGTGTLLLTNDAALGNASGGLAFSASGTINPTNNDVTLGAGRTVTISSGITATFGVSDVNTLYVASFITGPGSVAKGGSSYSLGWVCFTNDANNYTGDFSTSCGNLQFTSVAEQGTPSSLGAGAAATGGRITLANSISYGSLRYVGVGNSATHRPLYWTANGNIFALDNTGAGTIAYLATTQMVSGAGAKILTLQGSNTGTNTLAQAIGDSGGATTVSKSGAGTWILSGTNTYSGGTTIGAGTLAISGHGSIGASGNLTIAAGATLDVSGATGGYTLATGQTLVAGNGTSLVNGNLSLGGAALALFWTNGVPSLTISSNVLTMNNNATTVTVAGSAPLAVGGYKIISKGAGGSVSGAVSNSPVNVAGAGAGAVASLQITSGELYLNVVNGNGPPIANAGPDQKFGAGPIASVTLDASGSSDPRNRPLTYHWSQLSGWKVQLSNTNAVQPTFSYPWPGTYVFQLVVNDGLQDSAPALVGVVVGARAPVANAGPSFYVFTNSVTLDGTRSYEPDGYGALTCQWRQVSGPAVTLTGTNTPNPVVSGFTPTGTIQTCLFSLVVSDSLFASQPSTVTVTIVRNYNPNVLTLAVPPFDTNKPTVLMFGGGNCDTGSGGTWVGGTIPWTNLVNWITVGTYTDNYTSYGDMFAAYLSSVAPHYQKPIQTIGFSTGNYPAMEAAWYINSTFNDPRYAVNRVALLDAVCDNIDSYISQFVASPVAGGQCWVDSYISGDPNYATAKSYAGALNVKYIPHNTHGGVPDAYSGETWAPTAGTNFANAGLVAHAYLSVVGNGKNYQLNSAAQKYFFSDNPTNGVVSFYNQATYPGLMMSPVNLSGPANGATIATNGTSLGCGIVTNATQYQLLLGTNASRVMADYTVLLTTNAPPHQTITNLPGTNAWWTVLASDAYGSTIYADPRLIVRPANCPPVAVAGTNQAVVANTNGIAMVTLNGSKSTELNGIVQSYTWAWAVGTNSYLTNGVSPTIALPIGVYTIQLMVNDGQVNSQPAAVTITVVPLSPIIVLVAPTNNAVFAAPATIGLLATVTTNGNTINSVSFYNWGTNLIASVSPAPYAYSWTNVSAGVYSLSACLAYNNGSTVNSGPARLILAAQPAVTSPRFNYGAFGITFTTELGPVYEVEYQNVLGGPVWQLLTNVAGTSLPVTVTDNAATNTSRFYRLQVQ